MTAEELIERIDNLITVRGNNLEMIGRMIESSDSFEEEQYWLADKQRHEMFIEDLKNLKK